MATVGVVKGAMPAAKTALVLAGFAKSKVVCPTVPVVMRVQPANGTAKVGVKKMMCALVDWVPVKAKCTVLVVGKVGTLMTNCASRETGKAICTAKKTHKAR